MSQSKANLSRRWLLGGLLAGLASPVLAEAPGSSLRPRPRPGAAASLAGALSETHPAASAVPLSAAQVPEARALIEAARLGGDLGFVVLDARSGTVLEAHNAGRGMPPASVAKAATALFALDRLGSGHRFTTQVLATGPVQGGVLRGDLVLKGSGDPTLDTDALGDLAAQLRRAGITAVQGRFWVDGSRLPRLNRIDAEQPEHVGYNPAVSGLNLNFNRVHFEWKRGKAGWQVAMDARGQRHVPAVQMAEARIVERAAPLFTYQRREDRESWTVASASLGQGGSRWLPVRATEIYAGEVFQTLCAQQGIRLPGPSIGTATGGTVLAQISSAPLTTVLRDMLRHSTNLTAEVVGLSASGAGDLRSSAAQMNAWLQQRHGISAGFIDHSGLGGASRISAEAMARLMLRNPAIAEILRLFPTREARKPSGKGAKRPAAETAGPTVLAKTGTLNFVSGLSGMINAPRPLTFAIFAADVARRDSLPASERERPRGGPEWTRRARKLQADLLERWAALYA